MGRGLWVQDDFLPLSLKYKGTTEQQFPPPTNLSYLTVPCFTNCLSYIPPVWDIWSGIRTNDEQKGWHLRAWCLAALSDRLSCLVEWKFGFYSSQVFWATFPRLSSLLLALEWVPWREMLRYVGCHRILPRNNWLLCFPNPLAERLPVSCPVRTPAVCQASGDQF